MSVDWSVVRIANVLHDVGVHAMSTHDTFREFLSQFPNIEHLTPHDIAAIIAMMVSSQASVSDNGNRMGWNPNVFVDVIPSCIRGFQWDVVFRDLEASGYSVHQAHAYALLMEIWRLASNGAPFSFPNLIRDFSNRSLSSSSSTSASTPSNSNTASASPTDALSVHPSQSDGSVPSSDDIEEEANRVFSRIYTSEISLDQVVDMIGRFKTSPNERDRELYACMIHNLFDEYRFFHKYPHKELQITAVLFGSLIQHKLVSSFTLGIALRFVLEALKKTQDSKMFKFGVWSLEQFRDRLHQWPLFAALLSQIPHLIASQPVISAEIHSILSHHPNIQQSASSSSSSQMNIPTGALDSSLTAKGRAAFAYSPTGDAERDLNAGFAGNLQFPSNINSMPPTMTLQGQSDPSDSINSTSTNNNLANPVNLINPARSPSPNSATSTGPNPSASFGASSSNSPPRSQSPELSPQASPTPGILDGDKNSLVDEKLQLTPPSSSSNSNVTPSPLRKGGAPTAGSFGATLSIDSLLSAAASSSKAPLVEPSDSTKDKIAFILNNVSKANLRTKGKELKIMLKVEWYGWFAQYLVIKRVSLEPNNQKLYASFLEGVGVEPLRKAVLECTYDNIKVLLSSDKILTSTSERSLLKNLGTWLGLLTIARNKPVRAKYLDLKKLVLDAYDSGRLIAIIPFVAKVLESCSESRIFKPPNPWIMALVGLLREIFDLPGLKLNLKFEIEVLFNNLSIQMKDIKPSSLLKDRPNAGQGAVANFARPSMPTIIPPATPPPVKGGAGIKLPITPTPTAASGILGMGMGGSLRSPSPGSSVDLDQDALAASGMLARSQAGTPGNASAPPQHGAAPASNASAGAVNGASGTQGEIIPNLPTYVTISNNISLFNMYPALKRLVPTAIDRAIREIISPVVERSVTIACVTTRELILKDFALEPDETKMRSAAHQMVQNLTSSLALVTCKEPLRVSISNHLGSLVEANMNQPDRVLVEAACIQVSTENLELGCTLIEKAAAERAIREIDEALSPYYNIRIKHRQQTGQPYIDMTYYAPNNRYPASLPEPLRPKPGGLASNQLRVYEDFVRIRQHYAAVAAVPAPGTSAGTVPGKEGPAQVGGASAQPAAGLNAPRVAGPHTNDPRHMNEEELKRFKTGRAGAPSPPPAFPGQQQQQQQAGVAVGGGVRPASGPLGAVVGQADRRSPPLPSVNAAGTIGGSSLTAQQTLDKLLSCMASLEQAVLRFPSHKTMPLHSLSTANAAAGQNAGPRDDHEINVLLRLMQAILSQVPRDEATIPRDIVFLTFAYKVFKRLYERENRSSLLQIDVHIAVLKCIRSVCPKLVAELTQWLVGGDDDRKFVLPITAGLLRARLIVVADLDKFLSKLALSIHNTGSSVTQSPAAAAPGAWGQPGQEVLHPQLDYILALIRRVVVKRPILQVVELSSTLDVLTKIMAQARHKLVTDAISQLLDDVRHAAVELERQQQLAAQQGVSAPGGVSVSGPSAAPAPAAPAQQAIPQSHALGSNIVDIEAGKLVGGGGFGGLLDDDVDALDREVDEPEPTGLRQQFIILLDEWMNICLQGNASDKTYAAFLQMLQQQRVLFTPDSTTRFFRILIQLCIENSLASSNKPDENGQMNVLSYTSIDALAKLFVFLLKFYEPGAPSANAPGAIGPKIRLLSSFLNSLVLVIRRDADGSKASFNQRPYLRLFANLLHDLNTPDPLLDSNNTDILAAFAHAFYLLRPSRVPGFAFAWVELISHRMFMSKLLIGKISSCCALFARLLVALFRFLSPYLRNAELTDAVRLLYKGTLRLLLVLLHDFPEFLCDFHFVLCDVIPTSCIQMRNLILSAFPRNMRLPDPFTPNLKVDLLPEISQPPRIIADVTSALSAAGLRNSLLIPLDQYLKTREPASFLKHMLSLVTIPSIPGITQQEAQAIIRRTGSTYNIPLLNSLVMYVGMYGINMVSVNNANNNGMVSQFQDNSCMDLFDALIHGVDAHGRYIILNAIANQLRYPNNHTHYFSCVLLYSFSQCKDEVIMEQITRVLLERLIVHRPHPWGLLITFIELIKNPRYEFWRQPFTKAAPEIERLFESVARSCMPPPSHQQQAAATAAPVGPGAGGLNASAPSMPPSSSSKP